MSHIIPMTTLWREETRFFGNKNEKNFLVIMNSINLLFIFLGEIVSGMPII